MGLSVILSLLAVTDIAGEPAERTLLCEVEAAWIADTQTRAGYTATALVLDHFGPLRRPVRDEFGVAEPYLPTTDDPRIEFSELVDENIREGIELAPAGIITVSMRGWLETPTTSGPPHCSAVDLGHVEFVSDLSQAIHPEIRSFSEAENRAGALSHSGGDAPPYFEYQVYAFTYFAMSADETEAILGVELTLAGESLYYLTRNQAGDWVVEGERSLSMY